MFKTMIMDIRPQQTTPTPASATGPALAPAALDTPVTGPASAGPASPHDGSPGGDEGTNGHGVARRPGNLWTAEDREDMFNRRERGEGWETICADYPNRSRHAMQQQYSMMKKQKALADGTWSSNRRGRKRRNPAPERPAAAVKRAEQYAADMDENMTEVDEIDEPPSDDPDDSDDAGVRSNMANGRPNALTRSATDPTKATRGRHASAAAHAANGMHSDVNGTPILTQTLEPTPERAPAFPAVNRRKRRISADRGSNPNATPPMESTPAGAGNIVLNQEDIMSLLRKGADWARKSSRAIDEERATQALAFEQSLSRANKRATEAQEKFSYATFEHGETLKKARIEFSETLKAKTREHKEAATKLKADFDEQLRLQNHSFEAQVSQNNELKRELHFLKLGLPDREKEMEQEISRLRAEKLALEEAKKTWETTAKVELGSMEATSIPATQPMAASSPPAPVSTGGAALPSRFFQTESETYRAYQGMHADFQASASLVAKFHEEFEELNHKRAGQYLSDIATQTQNMAAAMQDFQQKLDRMHHDVSQTLGTASQPAPAIAIKVDPAVVEPAAVPRLNDLPPADAMEQDGGPREPPKHTQDYSLPPPRISLPEQERADVPMPDSGASS